MKRMVIALSVALVVIIVIGFVAYSFLSDYLVKSDSWLPDIDLERFVNDMAENYVEKLYESVAYPLLK